LVSIFFRACRFECFGDNLYQKFLPQHVPKKLESNLYHEFLQSSFYLQRILSGRKRHIRSEAAGMFIKEDTVRTHFDAPQSLQEAMAMGWMVTESKDTNPSMVPNNNCPVSELLLQRSWASSDCLGLSGMDGQWAVTRSLPLPDVTGQSAAVAQPSWHHHPAYQQDMMGEMMQMLLLFTQRCACL
jgi:hypothetical protein